MPCTFNSTGLWAAGFTRETTCPPRYAECADGTVECYNYDDPTDLHAVSNAGNCLPCDGKSAEKKTACLDLGSARVTSTYFSSEGECSEFCCWEDPLLSTGEITGIVIACLLVLGGCCFFFRKRGESDNEEHIFYRLCPWLRQNYWMEHDTAYTANYWMKRQRAYPEDLTVQLEGFKALTTLLAANPKIASKLSDEDLLRAAELLNRMHVQHRRDAVIAVADFVTELAKKPDNVEKLKALGFGDLLSYAASQHKGDQEVQDAVERACRGASLPLAIALVSQEGRQRIRPDNPPAQNYPTFNAITPPPLPAFDDAPPAYEGGKCTGCGATTGNDAKFCPECGSKQY